MALKTDALSDMGVLAPDLNPTLMQGRGARELSGLADLYNDGDLSLLPGYIAKNSAPLLASITNANSATTFSNGSRIVTDTTAATDFITNADMYKRAFPGDFLIGNDGVLYVIESVDSDTQITLKTPYEGADASSSTTYTIIHRLWMLQQFRAESGGNSVTVTQDYRDTTSGTFTNTRANVYGVSLTPELESYDNGRTYLASLLTGTTLRSTIPRIACPFKCPAQQSVDAVLIPMYYSGTDGRTFVVRVETDSAGEPSGTLMDTDATKAVTATGLDGVTRVTFPDTLTFTAGTNYWLVLRTTTSGGTWDVDDFLYVPRFAYGTGESIVNFYAGAKFYTDASSSWSDVFSPNTYTWPFKLLKYPTSGTNTYVGAVIDIGSTPAATYTATTTVTEGSRDYLALYGNINTCCGDLMSEFEYSSTYPGFVYSADTYPDTLSWTLATSASSAMTGSYTVLTSQTGYSATVTTQYTAATAGVDVGAETMTLSSAPPWAVGTAVKYSAAGGTAIASLDTGETFYIKTIAGAVVSLTQTAGGGGSAVNLNGTGNNSQYLYAVPNRYWQFTFTLTSASGASTPLVTGAAITVTNPANLSQYHDVAGCGRNVYRSIFGGSPATISTTEFPSGNPAGVAIYQRNLIWSTGGLVPRYWNGIGVAAANLDAMVKSDGSTAGTNPPWRADRIITHNDKLFLYRNVSGASGSSYGYYEASPRVSTTLAAAALTDTSSTWPSADNLLVGFRCYPCVNDASSTLHYPLKYWIISSNTGSGSTEVANCSGATMTDVGATGDGYLIAKFYGKAAWYCDETEPSHWPSTNVLQFNDEDGDILQGMISWNGRMVVVCRDQLWIVSGYGPTSPWSKQMIAPRGGTLSPWSVVDAGDSVMWLSLRGVTAYSGGYQRPQVISDPLRSIVLDINESAREQAVGTSYRGLVLWSYPSSNSNVNDTTLIYNPDTGRWAVQDFGMYCPSVFTDADGEETLYFQSVTTSAASGGIMEWDSGYSYGEDSQPISYKTSYLLPSSPTEPAQGIRVRTTILSGGDASLSVYYALEFKDEYTYAGTLEPIDSSVTGRTGVSSEDTVYACALPPECNGSAISIQLLGSTNSSLRILSLEFDSDAQEAATNR